MLSTRFSPGCQSSTCGVEGKRMSTPQRLGSKPLHKAKPSSSRAQLCNLAPRCCHLLWRTCTLPELQRSSGCRSTHPLSDG